MREQALRMSAQALKQIFVVVRLFKDNATRHHVSSCKTVFDHHSGSLSESELFGQITFGKLSTWLVEVCSAEQFYSPEVNFFWPAASDAVARFSLTYSRERWTNTCQVLWLFTIILIIRN